jgi:hypothetical protein
MLHVSSSLVGVGMKSSSLTYIPSFIEDFSKKLIRRHTEKQSKLYPCHLSSKSRTKTRFLPPRKQTHLLYKELRVNDA